MKKEQLNNKESEEIDYSLFLKSLGLHYIYLRKAKYELLVPKKILEGKSIQIQFAFTQKYNIDEIKKLLVLHWFKVIGRIEGIKKDVLEIEGEFYLEYSIKETPCKEIIEQFLNKHHVLHIWPYIREFIQNAARRMEIPPLVLPLSRPPKVKKSNKAK